MALTGKQIAWCRRMLAEHNAKELESARGSMTGRGRILRYWPDIPKQMHGPVMEFLGSYVSPSNSEMVRITGNPSVPGVLGDYVFNQTVANGQPVRTNGVYFLKAVHYEVNTNQWQWAIVDNNNMILFLTALTDDYIAHWADDWDEWKDEWAFEDELGVLEPVSALPELPEFEGQTLTMEAPADHLMVNEYGWVVTDAGATYNVTGSITLTAVAAQEAVYGVVKTPYVDGTPRSGTWSAGEVKLVETDGKKGPLALRWIVTQELFQEPQNYLLVGRKITETVTEDTRLYMGIAEGAVSETVATLAALTGFTVVESQARESSRPGMYNLYVTTINVTYGSYLVVGRKVDDEVVEETRLYPGIKEGDVTTTVQGLDTLGAYKAVDVQARRAKWDGVFDVYATVVSVNTGESALHSGHEETEYYTQDEYLYRNVAAGGVDALVGQVLGAAVLVSTDLRKTRWNGIYDVVVRTRTLKTTGVVLTIGGSGGLFKTTLKVIRHLAEDALAAQVAALTALPLIENVRSSRSGVDGFWDVYYSELTVPAPHTEYRNIEEFRENGYDGAFYNYVNGKMKVPTSVDAGGNPVYTWYDTKYRVVTGFWGFYSKQNKVNQQVITVSYSATQPAAPTVGVVDRLANGLWVVRSVANTHTWWNN